MKQMKIRRKRPAFLCIAVLSTLAPPAQAATLPLWEFGLGAAAVRLPNYRGSDVARIYILPAPYFVYRGDFFKADRSGVRSTLFNSDRVEINLSLNATLPVDTDDHPARRGMEDLKPTVEVGPTASLTLWRSADESAKLDFRAPLRSSFTVESSPRHIGWLFSPNLNLDVKDPLGRAGWKLGVLAGPLFHNREYNGYFYSVSPADAHATRPAYSAPGGYSGAQFTAALSKRFPAYWVGGFLRYDTLAGARFVDSPLVRKRSTVSAGIAISWVFSESAKRVEVDE